MNIANWIALAAVVVAALAIVYGRKDASSRAKEVGKSQKAAEASQKETERQVQISERIANTADQTFASSSQPIIVSDAIPDPPFKYLPEAVDERNRWHRGDASASIGYPIRNVGVGPAMIVSVKMTIIINKTRTTYEADSNVAVVAPSEIALMKLLVPTTNTDGIELFHALASGETLTAEISYTGIGARRRYLTRFVLEPRSHATTKDFRLKTTQVYECDEQGGIKGPPIASNNLSNPDGRPQD